MQEAGFKDFEITAWFAAYAPAGSPPDAIAKLEDWLNKAVASPETKEFLAQVGDRSDARHFGKARQADAGRTREVAQADADRQARAAIEKRVNDLSRTHPSFHPKEKQRRMIKPWVFEFFPELTDPSGKRRSESRRQNISRPISISGRATRRSDSKAFFSASIISAARTAVAQSPDCSDGGPHQNDCGSASWAWWCRTTTPWRIFEEIAHARSPHQRPARNRHCGRHSAGSRARRHDHGRGAREKRRGDRNSRRAGCARTKSLSTASTFSSKICVRCRARCSSRRRRNGRRS